MNRPPLIMRLCISGKRRGISLWLPLFLILLIAGAVAILMAPLIIIAAAILWPFGRGKLLLFSGPVIFGCLCALRGLEVDLKQSNRSLLISFK